MEPSKVCVESCSEICVESLVEQMNEACRTGQMDVIAKLLIHGVDVNMMDKFGWSAMECALSAIPFQPHVAQLLLDCSKMK